MNPTKPQPKPVTYPATYTLRRAIHAYQYQYLGRPIEFTRSTNEKEQGK